MKLTDKEKETIKYYDEQSKEWIDRHIDFKKQSAFYNQMTKLFSLKPTGKILEIGTGAGRDARDLINHYGLENYVGIDASVSLIQIAKSNNPDAKFIHTSIYDLEMLENNFFDVFWISAVVLHLPKERLSEALKTVKFKLKPKAFGFISMIEGNSNMENSRPGRYFTLWTREEFQRELKNVSFEIIEHKTLANPHGNDWQTYILRSS